MTHLRKALTTGLLLTSLMLLSAKVFAADTVTVQMSQHPSVDCQAAAATAAHLIVQFPHQDGWRYVVACDDATWSTLVATLHASSNNTVLNEARYQVYGMTLPQQSLTYLRATRLMHPELGDPAPAHTVAHELAHIYLHSSDEKVVDALATEWLKAKPLPDAHIAATFADGTGTEVIAVNGTVYHVKYTAKKWLTRSALLVQNGAVAITATPMDKGTCAAAHNVWSYGLCTEAK